MTSEEIRETIEQLRKLTHECGTYTVRTPELRDRLIELLEQADPYTHMELPVDADGKSWHIGDVMQWPDGVTGDVIGVGDGVLFYNDNDAAQWTAAGDKTHYHKPTFEDIVRDMLNDVVCTFDASGGCSAWMTDTKVAEYADRLRELMQDE